MSDTPRMVIVPADLTDEMSLAIQDSVSAEDAWRRVIAASPNAGKIRRIGKRHGRTERGHPRSTKGAVMSDDLRTAAKRAAEFFREYEQIHAAKPDPEKARRNAERAEMLDRRKLAALRDPRSMNAGRIDEAGRLHRAEGLIQLALDRAIWPDEETRSLLAEFLIDREGADRGPAK